MGTYNFFTGTCPHCSKRFIIQTKLTEGDSQTHRLGDSLPLMDMRIRLKELCSFCDAEIVAVIQGGKLTAFEIDQPDCLEGLWGAILPLHDSATEQFHREVIAPLRRKYS